MGPESDARGSGCPREPAQKLHREPQTEQYPGWYVDNAKENHDPDENVNVGVGIKHQSSAEDPGDGAARPDHWHVRAVVRKGLAQRGHDAAAEIEKEIAPAPKHVFDVIAEDPQEQHVADQ